MCRVVPTGHDTCLTTLASCVRYTRKTALGEPILDSDISTGAGKTTSSDYSPCIYGGFADGTIRVYDERVSSNGGCVYISKEHTAWIVTAHTQIDKNEIITGSVRGIVKFWDMRTMRTFRSLEVRKNIIFLLHGYNNQNSLCRCKKPL